ncbi:MAG TPA: hypothetical protein VMT89_02930 [Candidatus Acidoferrales bacterium]|nr:hypothetical protein [Candidatus Acidoferrales bacterium]
MKTYIATLESVSPYSQSRHYDVPKLEKESHEDYEKRTWRERCHVDDDGFVFIPPMAFKNALAECAKFLGIQIPGKGKQNYTKHFEAGVLVMDSVVLPLKKADVRGEWLFVPSDGRRGGGKRVNRCFPLIPHWTGSLPIHVLDETITKPVLITHLEEAGKFIGIGRFRPRNNGFYGRFKLLGLD